MGVALFMFVAQPDETEQTARPARRLAAVPIPCNRIGSAMLAPTVMRGLSEDNASWKTI